MSVVERAIDKLRRGAVAAEPVGRAAASLGSPEPIGLLQNTVADASALKDGATVARQITVDREALRASGYLPESEQDRRFADQYRNIKRPLIAAAFAPSAPGTSGPPSSRLIMMASALPGDGKTFTSINLALSMARERDTSVLLVDADVAKPHISRIFGVEAEPGLLDALGDSAIDIESLILPTDVPGLSILPAGRQRDGATELLASAQMRKIVERLTQWNRHGLVLFDSSPLLISSESRALANAVGQIALVVRAGRTPHHALLEAIGHLGQGKSVGLVLNEGRASLTEGIYGYGAYGNYGNYGGTSEAGDE
jgi:exopolysaccharide/PEP-CTERM locus tyrosine autokinase